MDDSQNEIQEFSARKDFLSDPVDISKMGFKTAATYFKDRELEDKTRYSHLESVVDNSHILWLDDDEMTKALQQLGRDIEHAKAIPAIYMGERGGVLVDAVIIRKGAEIKPSIMFHEFVHRSAAQREINRKGSSYDEQMYEILSFSKDKREKMKKDSPEEYANKLKDAKETIRIFNEGLAQWATLYLANKTEQFSPPVTDVTYADEVAAVTESFYTSLSTRGLSMEQIEEFMLDLALTGDFSRIRTVLSLGEDLKQSGIGLDFYIALLISGAENHYMLKKYDRILEK